MADNIMKRNGQFPILKTLNFFSPRPSSFTISIKKKKSTNPFFKLLDSPGKSAKVF
jgi:hypothetical protein